MWALGEEREAYAIVDENPSSATYTIYDCGDASVVTSGVATVSGHRVSCLWEPDVAGVYVTYFSYVVGSETLKTSQVVEVKETM